MKNLTLITLAGVILLSVWVSNTNASMHTDSNMWMNMMMNKNHSMGMGMENKNPWNWTMHEQWISLVTQLKINRLLESYFKKISSLDEDLQNKKVMTLLEKIETAQGQVSEKYPTVKNFVQKVLEYVYNKITIRFNMPQVTSSMMSMVSGEIFSEDVTWLPDAKKSEIVILKNWDTYEMSAGLVKQEVGNRTIKRLAYNGMIPGPIITVEKWSKINIRFTNNLDVETTVHSHGLRLDDSQFDGLPTTMWGEQKPMQPGESFTYELNFDDTGVFWYHPHIREDYTQEMWLYGNFHVTENGYWNKTDREDFLILDDFSENDIFYKDKVNKTLMGRFGNIMMINNDENYKLELKTGESTRLFITNVANTRTFDFSILDSNGKKVDMKLVWGDIGRIEHEIMIVDQIIAPAERYIVETTFSTPGTYTIQSKERKLGEIIVSGSTKSVVSSSLRENMQDYSQIRAYMQQFIWKTPDKKLKLSIDLHWMWMMGNMNWDMWMMNMANDGDEIEREENMAQMNSMSNDQMMKWVMKDEISWEENMDITWNFKKGDLVKVEIYNDPNSMHPMQHPIHFHGQRFVVLTRDGVINDNLQWKDTTLIKNWEKIEILLEMTNPWVWMSHCHIAEHLQSGMMMTFNVAE